MISIKTHQGLRIGQDFSTDCYNKPFIYIRPEARRCGLRNYFKSIEQCPSACHVVCNLISNIAHIGPLLLVSPSQIIRMLLSTNILKSIELYPAEMDITQ